MTGIPLTGIEAARIGLINHAVPSNELDEQVKAFAQRLAEGPQKAIRWTKVSVNIGLKQLASSVLEASLAYEWNTWETKDHREAVNAFLEKRKPSFTGE